MKGLTPEVVKEISRRKKEPAWMLNLRLNSLKIYHEMNNPDFGPDLSELNLAEISTYIEPTTTMVSNWDQVPSEIRKTFERLGIPQAEQEHLAGAGAQYDSELVYHSLKERVVRSGVVYLPMEEAVKDPKFKNIVRSHFMKLLPASTHKYMALHGAVWSGGSFVYVPKGAAVEIPIQSYFRFNAPGAGQFEHTLIILEEDAYLHFIEGCSAPKYNVANLHAGCVELYVGRNSYLKYSTVESWSKNMYNLNTKRAEVLAKGTMEWVTGSFGSKSTMLYPSSILKEPGARSEYTGVTFAASGQNLDTGVKMIHLAPETSSYIDSRTLVKDGGIATFRSLVIITAEAKNSKSFTDCKTLILDQKSTSDTLPVLDVSNSSSTIGHEASVGKISDKEIHYLMTRGISEDQARAMIVRGFTNQISKELPLEYAMEMNNLIRLEMEGTS